MSRRVRYQVAVSLDGFIADPKGGYDWIVTDPAIDFAALYREFDTAVMGRRTYEVGLSQGADGSVPGMTSVVFSRTLPPVERKGVRIVNDDAREFVRALKAKPGGDIWLFGGGQLFRSLLDAGLVDTVEVAVMPVLLGEGIPLLPPGARATLTLTDHKVLPKSGIVCLAFKVAGSRAAPPRIGFIRRSPTSARKAKATPRTKKRRGAKRPRRR